MKITDTDNEILIFDLFLMVRLRRSCRNLNQIAFETASKSGLDPICKKMHFMWFIAFQTS